jgi:hypothetical protein
MRLTPFLPLYCLALTFCGNSNSPAKAPVWSLGPVEDTTSIVSGSESNLTGLITTRCQGVAIGFEGITGPGIGELRLRCAELKADGTLGFVIPGGSMGSGSGTAQSVTCPTVNGEPTVLVGDVGYHDGDLEQTNGRCRLLADVLAGLANDTAGLRTGTFGGPPQGGSTSYDVACPDGWVIIGFRGREGFTSHLPVEIGYLCQQLRYQ